MSHALMCVKSNRYGPKAGHVVNVGIGVTPKMVIVVSPAIGGGSTINLGQDCTS